MCKVREEGGIRDKGEFFTCVIIWMVEYIEHSYLF